MNTIFSNLKNLDDRLYEDYESLNTKFFVDSFKRRDILTGYTGEGTSDYLNTIEITEQLKEQDFSPKNISYVLNLPFPMDSISKMGAYLRKWDIIKIRVEEIYLIQAAKNADDKICKAWDLLIEFNMIDMNDITLQMTPTYKLCKADVSLNKRSTNMAEDFDSNPEKVIKGGG